MHTPRPPLRTEIQVRFNDSDMLGHLNNTSFAAYAEQARVAFFRPFDLGKAYLILAHIALDFRRQVRLGENVYVLTWIEKLGRTSVTLAQDIYANGELAVNTRSVVVLFDYQAQKPVPLSDELRARWEEYIQ